ncbi:MAG: ankyrin repeat domain-containing protein [Gammaproteobacteria bacterium]
MISKALVFTLLILVSAYARGSATSYPSIFATLERSGSLLMQASVKGDITEVNRLLKKGANPNYQDRRGMPILGAVLKARPKNLPEIVKALARAGADVNARHYVVPIAFDYVSYNKRCDPKVLNILFKYGLNPNDYEPIAHESVLESAVAYGGNSSCISTLIMHGGRINHTDYGGNTPLIQAVYRKDPSIVLLLLLNGAKPNISDEFGNTPLMAAAFFKSKSIVTLLLQHGANPCFRNEDGSRASDIAKKAGDDKLAALLACHRNSPTSSVQKSRE